MQSRPSAPSELQALFGARRLVWALASKELRARYVGSAVGFFWTVVNPIVELVTYTFVFYRLLDVSFTPGGDVGQYVLFVFCGMLAWAGFADAISRCTGAITEHAHLVRKVNFPAVVLVAHLVLATLFNQGVRLLVLLLGAIVLGNGWSWHILLALPFFVIQAVLSLGVGLLLATLNVYFRDMVHWVSAGLMIGLFVTPVFYPASAYPKQFVLLLYPNPLAQLIGIYRSLLLDQQIPAATSMGYVGVTALGALVVGASVFAHNRREFSDLV